MDCKSEIVGSWAVSRTANEKWTGTLKLVPGGPVRLEVNVPTGFLSLTDNEIHPIIQGTQQNGAPVSLLFPAVAGSRGGSGMTQLRFTAGYAIFGVALSEALKVNSISIEMENLHCWSGLTGFSPVSGTNDEFSIHYRLPEKREFDLEMV